MKVYKIWAASAITLCISVSTAFAVTDPTCMISQNSHYFLSNTQVISDKEEKDPIKRLQEKKEKINTLLEQGKITKENAQKKIELIDAKIRKIEEFNKLPLEEKKEKLIKNFKTFTEDMVKKGKITKHKADELQREYQIKVKEWDGNGNPPKPEKLRKKHKPFNKKRVSA